MGAWLKHVKQFLNQFTSVYQENQNSSKMIFSQIHLDQIHLCLQVNGLEVQTNQQSRFLLKVDLLQNQKLNSNQQLLKVKEEKPKTETEWKQEVEALNKRVAYLEAEIAKKDFFVEKKKKKKKKKS